MRLSSDEKQFLYELVKHQLNSVVKERKTIVTYPEPGFIAGEQQYEAFLKALVKKLKNERKTTTRKPRKTQ